jgi:hypothetical protein
MLDPGHAVSDHARKSAGENVPSSVWPPASSNWTHLTGDTSLRRAFIAGLGLLDRLRQVATPAHRLQVGRI